MKILSIDAWGNGQDGYDWNDWFNVGSISKEEFETLKTDKDYRLWFRRNGYTTTANARKCYIGDDKYNIVIYSKKSGAPLYAIEYGPEY